MTCNAKLAMVMHRDGTKYMAHIIPCTIEGGHNQHSGQLMSTNVRWLESDRRTFRGEFEPCRDTRTCTLPNNHRGTEHPI